MTPEILSFWLKHILSSKADSKSDAGEKEAVPELKEYVTQDRAHKALLPQYQVCVCSCVHVSEAGRVFCGGVN